jgi:hypothetical protein
VAAEDPRVLVRLVYASRAVGTIDDALIRSILASSELHNPEHGITGLLCTQPGEDVFLQAIEGARRPVNDLYNAIVRDPRHAEVTLLHYSEVQERRFASWKMGSVDLKKVNLSTILRYSERPVLNPFTMSGQAALALLEELAATAAIVSHGER